MSNIVVTRKNNFVVKALCLVLFLAFFIFTVNIFNHQIKNFFYHISSPTEKKIWNFNTVFSASVSSIFHVNSLTKENYELKRENQELLSQILFLQSLNRATDAKAAILNDPTTSNFNLLMTSIVGSDEQGMILINKGLADGLKNNMPVVNQQNILFGKVAQVYQNFSKVMLVSDKRSIINVKIKNDNPGITTPEVSGLLKGDGDLKVYVDLIPIESQIAKGDIVVTSALEKIFPKDLLIGRVTDIQKNSQKPFQQAKVAPFLDVASTDYLFVIVDYKKE